MHRRGYCHRDLKPWNIMMSSDLDAVKIIDFGYATPLNLDELARSS
jgi:serine/threonine protein kinase